MRVVIQRVKKAEVQVDGHVTGQIETGLLILAGVEKDDSREDALYLAKKIASLRVFEDENGKMNHDIAQARASLLLVSQFTLHASTAKGNRPSWDRAAAPHHARALLDLLHKHLELLTGKPVASGQFGANMQVELVNDGPVTIIMDSRQKEF